MDGGGGIKNGTTLEFLFSVDDVRVTAVSDASDPLSVRD